MEADAFVIDIPLRSGYEAAGHGLSRRRGVIVALSDAGLTGWGEFVELPGYSPETTETALASLAGSPVTHSNPMAVSARRTAELDLEAKTRGVSLAALLGASPGPVAAGAVVARFGDVAATLSEAAERVAEGYRKLKIKIGPGFDLEPLAELRNRYPDLALAADANGAYRPGEVPSGLDEVDLLYLEQPYRPETGWEAFARLRTNLSTPICLDESITTLPTLRSAIAAAACDAVNVKPARLVGLRAAVEIHDLAVDAGLGLVVGGLLETGIGRAASAALARLPGFTFPADLSASGRYWDRDLTTPEWELVDGTLEVMDRPGIGVEVDADYLDEIAESRHSLPH
ncbi:MAG: o-succinylbenzoate synthase [Acidimicrobiia bacterium]|nr:MAG: o-succinylbenzoate synthase [Acidimicrobiia bacterium]